MTKLQTHFQKQADFSQGYSPLYARLFGLLAEWTAVSDHPITQWLNKVGAARQPFDITLLLLGGLHRELLLAADGLALANYYPSVGGKLSPDHFQLASDLQAAIEARTNALAAFIQTATVQTNETGRGLSWLLPLHYTGWSQIHLIDLGASAGLNLLAEQRHYRLEAENGRLLTQLGSGTPPQFTTQCEGDFLLPAPPLPQILSRHGCDLAPFALKTAVAEQTLAAYVWPDQLARMARLREGIAAYREIEGRNDAPRLYPVNLPDELPRFLQETAVSKTANAPVLLYNTYMTAYLHDKGRSLRDHIAAFAQQRSQPTVWVQWEPKWGQGYEQHKYWCAWTADLWQNGEHYHFHLGWVQPHGTHAHFLEGLAAWQAQFL